MLSVVIPTHNRSAKLADTLDRLAGQSVRAGWEVVVVANRCTDETTATVYNLSSDYPVVLRVVEEPAAGAAAARNAGSRSAAGTDILFMDDDILVEPDCLKRLLDGRRRHPAAWIVGQVLPLPEQSATPFGSFRATTMPATPTTASIERVRWFASGLAIVPKRSLVELGGYEEGYHGAAMEDADLAIRADRAGIDILFDPGLVGIHNDWAGASLQDFCRRQRMYCATAPILERRFGATGHPWSELIAANRPPRWGHDGPTQIATKLAKHVLGMKTTQKLLVALAVSLERVGAPVSVRWFVYRSAIAGAMYSGYQEGLR
jgi:GT2 family glycosyltransferase